mmetsp:Transcript_122006/g.356463  ORF Transcript_122006/g.356463 Transcript_122006/m.356463 type:complete len:443 (+) Transcript_122006:77-1405(+)
MEAAGSGEVATPAQIAAVTAVPALAMALGSAAISAGEPSERLQARLQHFSAGLLIGAVVTDIFPILKERLVTIADGGHKVVQWASLVAAFVGFSLALLLMYGVKSLEFEDGENKEAAGDKRPRYSTAESVESYGKGSEISLETPLLPPTAAPGCTPGLQKSGVSLAIARLDARSSALSLLVAEDEVDREAVDEEVHGIDFLLDAARRSCRKAAPIDLPNASRLREHAGELAEDISAVRGIDPSELSKIDKQLKVIAATLRHIHSHVDRGIFRRWRPQHVDRVAQDAAGGVIEIPTAKLPWGLVLAVVIDSILDGMLIGLAGSVALMSGGLMAMATAIEMGFLGYSFACSVVKSARRFRAVAILGLPPLAMLASSMTAFTGASYVEGQPSFVGLIAFALVALLFLVVEELLLEAHEKEGSEVWHISGWLYIGLLLSICLDVAV